MHGLNVFDSFLIVGVLAFIFWPPFLMMIPLFVDDSKWYDGISSKVMMLPRYRLFEFATFATHALFAGALLTGLIMDTHPFSHNEIVIATIFLAFARITMCHVMRMLLFRKHSPMRALVVGLISVGLSVTLAILYGVTASWISMGLMIGVVLMDLYFVAMFINCYMAATGKTGSRRRNGNTTVVMMQSVEARAPYGGMGGAHHGWPGSDPTRN